MNKIIKIGLIFLFVVITLVSVGFNAYYFGWTKLQNYWEQQGVNLTVSQIYTQAKQAGEVKIGDVTLVNQAFTKK